MRRIVLIATAVGMLVAAGAAYAAINTYTANLTFTTKKAGTVKKPVPIGFTENLTASGTNGNRTAVLDDIKTTIYGVKPSFGGFPTCSLNKIAAAKNDTSCPKGALVATGYITAVVGSPTDFQAAAAPCNPALDVWNSGSGKMTFFFVDTPAHNCNALGLKTGSTGPYPATVKQSGKNLVMNVPIPSFVNRPLGLAGSLESEHLVFVNRSMKAKGKTVNWLTSDACQGKKRPWSVSFTATFPPTNQTETSTKSGSGTC